MSAGEGGGEGYTGVLYGRMVCIVYGRMKEWGRGRTATKGKFLPPRVEASPPASAASSAARPPLQGTRGGQPGDRGPGTGDRGPVCGGLWVVGDRRET